MDRAEMVRRVEEHYRTFWQGDLDDVDGQLSPAFHDAGSPPGSPQGIAAVKAYASAARSAFPDMTVTIDDALAEGPVVVVHATWRGTHTGASMGLEPSGRSVEVSGIVVWEFDDDGRIGRRTPFMDMGEFMRQTQAA
jgi:steroid delta-isomerase-like uncharacterized protein